MTEKTAMPNALRKAKTLKEISGVCIPTVPKGTDFEVVEIVKDRGYATCKGLPVSSLWLEEFSLVENNDIPL